MVDYAMFEASHGDMDCGFGDIGGGEVDRRQAALAVRRCMPLAPDRLPGRTAAPVGRSGSICTRSSSMTIGRVALRLPPGRKPYEAAFAVSTCTEANRQAARMGTLYSQTMSGLANR